MRYFAHVGFLYTEIAHAGQFLLYSSYVPGVISAALLLIPYMAYFLWLLAENRCISVKYIVKYASLL
ncbi:HXXEE domain-containing protein [Parageobacillus thermoglucosidasius]|uniref:HXXEE domain-containing protein n=1 Tax=Parageobacillus thermoglucosidasius TaxID=1426 RepID=UPI00055172B1|nr:MAG: HXXEE domain-containing protein [Geobacillus sp.]